MATITDSITKTVTQTVSSATSSSTLRAPVQGGIIDGLNPVVYNPTSPIILFIIQAGIILIFCRLLQYPLAWLRQPRVIAEVIGGILLGPSVMGRIPGFTDTIFPTTAMPNLTLVANIGLLLFLFIVGLEVDIRWFTSNWKPAVSVGLAGMILPFGLGCALSVGLYNQFKNEPGVEPVAFPTFMLFIGVATAITAFPVLCRILTELQLLSTPVGAVVLSAGIGNDVVGWILLALSVALVNASSGLTTLWILFTAIGYALFLVFAVRPAFLKLLKRTRSPEDGPSQSIIAITLLMTLTSAFFTGVIGIHPIFGAFMLGLICPHEGGFAIAVTEKVEDLVSTLFLPLYFALSGLSTNLGLLDTGAAWGYVFAAIGVAFVGKFVGGSVAARLNGLVWRESFTIGVLMACKGLVELIVLNIGLQAKILSQRTFTIFVVMALVCTFATTPLTTAIYPPSYQRKLEAWRRGEINWDDTPTSDHVQSSDEIAVWKLKAGRITRLTVYLRMDAMGTLLSFVSLLGGERTSLTGRKHPSIEAKDKSREGSISTERKQWIDVHGVRLIELGDRSSAVMKVSEIDDFTLLDPVINTFRVLARLFNVAVSGEVAIAPEGAFAETLVGKASEGGSDLLLLPWSETGTITDTPQNHLDNMHVESAGTSYSNFVAKALEYRGTNVAVFVNKASTNKALARQALTRPCITRPLASIGSRSGMNQFTTTPSNTPRGQHIFVPFCGGDDGREALKLALQLAENPEVTATIVHFKTGAEFSADTKAQKSGVISTVSRPSDDDEALFATFQRSLPRELEDRVMFESVAATSPSLPLHILTKAQSDFEHTSQGETDALIIPRHVPGISSSPTPTTCLGPLADALLESDLRASLIVVQSRESGYVVT